MHQLGHLDGHGHWTDIADVRHTTLCAHNLDAVYAMLGRATKRTNIKVLGELRPQDFVPVDDEPLARGGNSAPQEGLAHAHPVPVPGHDSFGPCASPLASSAAAPFHPTHSPTQPLAHTLDPEPQHARPATRNPWPAHIHAWYYVSPTPH